MNDWPGAGTGTHMDSAWTSPEGSRHPLSGPDLGVVGVCRKSGTVTVVAVGAWPRNMMGRVCCREAAFPGLTRGE